MFWHLLSLDAPTVATVWLLFISRISHTPLPPALPILMGLGVWLIYVADRLLDSAAEPDTIGSAHRFQQDHRRAFLLASVFVTAAVAALLFTLPAALLGAYLVLATILFAWLLLIHFTDVALPKPYAPGVFFPAATFLPTLLWSSPSSAAALLFPALSFAAICTLNCLLLKHWERHPQPAGAPRLRAFAVALVVSPLLFPSPVSHAVSLSAAALLALAERRARLHPATLRAAADLALLTPLLVLGF